MTGARLPYLERRQGMWNLRVRVPDSAKLRVGMLEVRRSLRTYSSERARLLAAPIVAQLQEIFRMALAEPISKEEVRALIERCFRGLSTATEATLPAFTHPSWEREEQLGMIDERLVELRAQIRNGDFEADVERTARFCQVNLATPRSPMPDVWVRLPRSQPPTSDEPQPGTGGGSIGGSDGAGD